MMFLTTTTPLGSAGTWNSTTPGNVPGHVTLTSGGDTIRGSVYSDQSGTIYIEQSGDHVNWDVSTSYAITGGNGQGFVENVVSPYCRLRYVNGATAQTAFRLFCRIHSNDQSNG